MYIYIYIYTYTYLHVGLCDINTRIIAIGLTPLGAEVQISPFARPALYRFGHWEIRDGLI